MPNLAKMEEIFHQVLKKYESADAMRMYHSPVRFRTEEQKRLKTEVANFKKFFEEAKNEA